MRLLVYGLFACLLAAAPAAASAWRTGTEAPTDVAFAGSHVEWLAPLRNYATGLFDAHRGSSPRRLQVFSGGNRRISVDSADFAASASAVVLQQNSRTSGTPNAGGGDAYGTKYLVGAVGQPLASFYRCDSSPGVAGADVSGATIAVTRCDGTLEIRDVGGLEDSQIVGTDVHLPKIAGRYVAWLEGEYQSGESKADIVVYDREARIEAYGIPAAAIPASIYTLDVQDDGKIAFSFYLAPGVPDSVVAAWASPAEPSVHRLRLPPRFGYDLRIANDRIVFDRYRRFSRSDRQELGIADLNGHARLVTREAFGHGAFDYDGSNVVYVRRTCSGYVVKRISPSAKAQPRKPCRRT